MQSKQAINTWIIFAVVCLVAWLFKESEAGDDFVLLEICMLLLHYKWCCSHADQYRNLHKKSSEVSIKTWSTPASLSFKGQATKHTTIKWSIAKYWCIKCVDRDSDYHCKKITTVKRLGPPLVRANTQNSKGSLNILFLFFTTKSSTDSYLLNRSAWSPSEE